MFTIITNGPFYTISQGVINDNTVKIFFCQTGNVFRIILGYKISVKTRAGEKMLRSLGKFFHLDFGDPSRKRFLTFRALFRLLLSPLSLGRVHSPGSG